MHLESKSSLVRKRSASARIIFSSWADFVRRIHKNPGLRTRVRLEFNQRVEGPPDEERRPKVATRTKVAPKATTEAAAKATTAARRQGPQATDPAVRKAVTDRLRKGMAK